MIRRLNHAACIALLAGFLATGCGPTDERVRVDMYTSLGTVELAIDTIAAPITGQNFLRYVREGFYDSGIVHRVVRMDNQPRDSVFIEVIQAMSDTARNAEVFDPIQLERTSQTGLSHVDGAISMARTVGGPNSAVSSFFICIGDQPELDFGGRRNPDGQGFAAFGQVLTGMEIVRQIQQMEADGQYLNTPFPIDSVRVRN